MESASVARVLAVDDHPLTLEIICAVLQKVFPRARVQGLASLDEALRCTRVGEPPEMVVLDLGLPGCGGLEALARLKAACPAAAIVVYSAADDGDIVRAALRAGARGYIPKSTGRQRMQIALELVADGGVYVPPEAMAGTGESEHALSDRQLGVLRQIARGHSNRRIARAMGISESTVKHHTSAIFRALGVSSRAQAIVAARRRGLLSD
jgi:DNA-binding NarL/FixJ family response regulator